MPQPSASRVLVAGLALFLAIGAVAGCAPEDQAPSTATSSASDCAKASLPVKHKGRLTIGTDKPAYDPWFSGNDPSNGKGFESAVAYAVAGRLGFAKSEVDWQTVPFNSSYAPGPKNFDFDINQISITTARKKAVDFSRGYYTVNQALVALKGTKAARAKSIADLRSLRLGAQVGTTSLTYIQDTIKPTRKASVYNDTNDAKSALVGGTVDGVVVDLPTAFYLSAAEIKNSTIVGQFEAAGAPEQFGLLFEKGDKLVPCVDKALDALDKDGTLAKLQKTWLSEKTSVPVLS